MINDRSYDGLEYSKETIHGLKVSHLNITTQAMANHFGWLMGEYISIRTERLRDITDLTPVIECLAECLKRCLEPYFGKKLLIVGIGNADFLPYSLGPKVVRNIPAYSISLTDTPCTFKSVSLLTPGTLWQTNTSTAKIIFGTAQAIDADCVLFVDVSGVMALRDMAKGVDLSTAGLRLPGCDEPLTIESLGRPLLTVSVPLLLSIPPEAIKLLRIETDKDSMMLMDADIAPDMKTAVTIVSRGILRAIYPELDLEKLQNMI